MEGIRDQEERKHDNHKSSHFILERVRVSFLLFTRIEDVKVLHETGEKAGYSNSRENTHHWSQYQHQTDHHALQEAGRQAHETITQVGKDFNLLQNTPRSIHRE